MAILEKPPPGLISWAFPLLNELGAQGPRGPFYPTACRTWSIFQEKFLHKRDTVQMFPEQQWNHIQLWPVSNKVVKATNPWCSRKCMCGWSWLSTCMDSQPRIETTYTYFLPPRGTKGAVIFGNFYLIKRKCWGLMWWQLFLWCCWCWGLWERGLWLDWTHLHSTAARDGQVRINEDILIRKKKDTSLMKISGRNRLH